MEEIITQLETGITSTSLFSTVADVMPFVIQILPFAIGYMILKKSVKGISKLKVRF